MMHLSLKGTLNRLVLIMCHILESKLWQKAPRPLEKNDEATLRLTRIIRQQFLTNCTVKHDAFITKDV